MRGSTTVTVEGISVSESSASQAGPSGKTGNAENEVVDLCRELIRIDTSNYGDHSGPGERLAAEYVAEKLAEVGLEPKIFESHKGRASTVARIEGEDPPGPRSSSTGIRTSSRPTRRTGPTTRSPARSRTAASGDAARST